MVNYDAARDDSNAPELETTLTALEAGDSITVSYVSVHADSVTDEREETATVVDVEVDEWFETNAVDVVVTLKNDEDEEWANRRLSIMFWADDDDETREAVTEDYESRNGARWHKLARGDATVVDAPSEDESDDDESDDDESDDDESDDANEDETDASSREVETCEVDDCWNTFTPDDGFCVVHDESDLGDHAIDRGDGLVTDGGEVDLDDTDLTEVVSDAKGVKSPVLSNSTTSKQAVDGRWFVQYATSHGYGQQNGLDALREVDPSFALTYTPHGATQYAAQTTEGMDRDAAEAFVEEGAEYVNVRGYHVRIEGFRSGTESVRASYPSSRFGDSNTTMRRDDLVDALVAGKATPVSDASDDESDSSDDAGETTPDDENAESDDASDETSDVDRGDGLVTDGGVDVPDVEQGDTLELTGETAKGDSARLVGEVKRVSESAIRVNAEGESWYWQPASGEAYNADGNDWSGTIVVTGASAVDETPPEPTGSERADLDAAIDLIQRRAPGTNVTGRADAWVAMSANVDEFDDALAAAVDATGVVVWKADREDGFISIAVERLAQYL